MKKKLFQLFKLPKWKIHLAYGLGKLSPESAVPSMLSTGQWVGLVYLDIVDFVLTEQSVGPSRCLRILQSMENIASQEVPHHLKPYQLLEVRRWGDDLLIYFYSQIHPPPDSSTLANIAFSLKDQLSLKLNQQCSNLMSCHLNFHVGYTIVNSEQNPEKSLYNAFKEAMIIAKSPLDVKEVERRQQFKDILAHKNIRIVYQPVVNLNTGEILGYEALSRGPENTFFTNPINLFSYAQKTHHLYTLEKIAREKALAGLGDILSQTKVFININPQVVKDPSFRPDEIDKFLTSIGAEPNQVVFEITERTSIDDFPSFRRSLEHYRQNGFLIAIDDAGAGYSSLQAIAEIQPDFIKIDNSLIKDIDKTATKKKLLETFHIFAQKTNSQLIAEGIETEEELVTLKKMDISFGQGFFLARPNYPPPVIDSQALFCLENYNKDMIKTSAGRILPVRNIAQIVPALSANAITKEALDFFTAYPTVEGIAVVKDEIPVGLVMRNKLFNQLGTKYGFAVYTERPISLVMDIQPLTVEDDTTVEIVSQSAMGRHDHKVYDSIIVTKNKCYQSLVSVRALLDMLTNMQMEAARFANPLTGLPGNLRIEEEILNRISTGQPFSVLYADRDNFKGFNDRYGFERGDLALEQTAEIITKLTREFGNPDDFVGHIGGDDFVVVTVPEVVNKISQGICDELDRLIVELYDPEDRQRGKISTVDRKGNKVEIPIMSISLAVIDCLSNNYPSLEELSRAAAELKKLAKKKPGSLYVKERRHRENLE